MKKVIFFSHPKTEAAESMDYYSHCEEESDAEENEGESESTEPAESVDDNRNCDEQSDAEEENNFFLSLKRKRNDESCTGSRKKKSKRKNPFIL